MKKVTIFSLILILMLPSIGFAAYTEDTYWNTTHDQPAWFEADLNGGFFGETVAGDTFTQNPVFNEQNLKLHKFTIGTAFFYISDKVIIRAESDLRAVSIYFSSVT